MDADALVAGVDALHRDAEQLRGPRARRNVEREQCPVPV